MNDPSLEETQVDGVLLGWLIVWSIVLSLAAGSFSGLRSLGALQDEDQLMLAGCVGGLVATWAAMGTWLTLIHVPEDENPKRYVQRVRVAVSGFLIANAIVISTMLRSSPSLVSQLLLMTITSCLGPFLIWQWSRRPIHRGPTPPIGQRNIRQILGIAVTIAVGNVLFKIASGWLDLSHAMVTLVLSIAASWTFLLLALLGRQWAWIIGLAPLCIGQPFLVLFVIDLESNNADEQALIIGGTYIGFYLFALLYLSLLRSNGHNWFRSSRLSG
ncbi:hypothetical protein [Rhodopirellula bahusiensis]|uniref:Transmembrane protein n=1 Tax=Rhodopirellula bahusiensis TaxID=2014065 RepID=A0A2G1VYU8_9BACT|nr:hypothetical protein [Rhodopirellula bahusiensis]PHQ31968.1 hypothetical protein CEE69_28320 [Rhodopirellula bahusiensis]